MTKLIKTFALCLLLLGCSAEKDYNTAIITAKGEVLQSGNCRNSRTTG